MGFELKDLVAGTYFKGYHAPAPQGQKCFYYVHSTCSQGGLLQADVLFHYRGGAGNSGWFPQTLQGPPNQDTLLKRSCRPGDLKAEGVPFPVAKPAVPAVSPPIRTAPVVKSPLPPTSTQPTEAELARAKRNAGKVVLPENAKSSTCVKCGGSNKLLLMFSFSAYTCTRCEPQ